VRIVWTPEAERDRAAIWDYLAARDPAAALKIDRLFGEAVARLAEFPLLGHEGPVAGTREVNPHRSYRIVYEVVDETVWILVLIHTARQWPPLPEERAHGHVP
jgi:addiction module RelE/StbE family toxin